MEAENPSALTEALRKEFVLRHKNLGVSFVV